MHTAAAPACGGCLTWAVVAAEEAAGGAVVAAAAVGAGDVGADDSKSASVVRVRLDSVATSSSSLSRFAVSSAKPVAVSTVVGSSLRGAGSATGATCAVSDIVPSKMSSQLASGAQRAACFFIQLLSDSEAMAMG